MENERKARLKMVFCSVQNWTQDFFVAVALFALNISGCIFNEILLQTKGISGHLGKRHIIIDFVHEKRHMDVFPLRNVTHFFLFYRGPCGIIYLAGFKVVYKSIKVHLG